MGMRMTFYALSAKNLAELVAHPDRLAIFEQTREKDQKRRSSMSAEDYEKYLNDLQKDNKKFKWQYNNPWVAYEDSKKVYKSRFEVDLGKSWHGIHFLLTRGDKPNSWLSWLPFISNDALHSPILGGNKVGDGGAYGENASFSAQQVRQLNMFLTSHSILEWGKNYDPSQMTKEQIYPSIWEREEKTAYDDFILPNLERLIAFFGEAAGQNLAVFKVLG